MTRKIGKSKVGNPSGRDLENQSIDKKLEIPKLESKYQESTVQPTGKEKKKPNVYTSLTTEKAEIEARQPVLRSLSLTRRQLSLLKKRLCKLSLYFKSSKRG